MPAGCVRRAQRPLGRAAGNYEPRRLAWAFEALIKYESRCHCVGFTETRCDTKTVPNRRVWLRCNAEMAVGGPVLAQRHEALLLDWRGQGFRPSAFGTPSCGASVEISRLRVVFPDRGKARSVVSEILF